MNKRNIHFVIVNAHWSNRGDEAALLALINGLKKINSSYTATIIFKDNNPVKSFPQIPGVTYFSAKFTAKIINILLTVLTRGCIGSNKLLNKTVKTIMKSDVIIYSPGGSVINDRFYWSKQLEYLTPFICAKFFNIPIFIASPSIGPFLYKRHNFIRKFLLKTPKFLCVREEISKEYLKQISIISNVYTTMDLAFLEDIDLSLNERKLTQNKELKKFIDSNKKIIGITLTDFKWHVVLRKDSDLLVRIKSTFHKFLHFLIEKGYCVLLIPQLFGNQNDSEYLKDYLGENILILDETYNADFQQFIISKLFAHIGMRYHSNIFAAKMGTPFIAIAYEEKMEGFMELSNITEYSIPLKDIEFGILYKKFTKLEDNYLSIKQNLENKRPQWKVEAEKTLNMLHEVIMNEASS